MNDGYYQHIDENGSQLDVYLETRGPAGTQRIYAVGIDEFLGDAKDFEGTLTPYVLTPPDVVRAIHTLYSIAPVSEARRVVRNWLIDQGEAVP